MQKILKHNILLLIKTNRRLIKEIDFNNKIISKITTLYLKNYKPLIIRMINIERENLIKLMLY
jgi:hypothetical protein